jgi:hypothetical protein
LTSLQILIHVQVPSLAPVRQIEATPQLFHAQRNRDEGRRRRTRTIWEKWLIRGMILLMKQVPWLQKLCLGSCLNWKGRDTLQSLINDGQLIGTEAFKSRATGAEATGASATAAVALGALAIGGLAFGFLAIGRLLIRQMIVQQVHLRRLKIDQLDVEELRVSKLIVIEEQRATGGPGNALAGPE